MLKPSSRDILGQLAFDYFNDLNPEDIVVHSDLCDPDILPLDILFRTEDQLFPVEKVALPLCEGSILDVGSGTGSLMQILKSKGKKIQGIDTSQGLIDYQIEKGLESIKVDFFDFESVEKFDTILMMMNGIGIVGTLSELPNFFKKLDEILAEEGKALIDSSDIAYMYENEDGSISINLNQSYYGEMKYQMQYKENFGEWFDWLYIDFETLSNLAKQYGFQAKIVFEDENDHYLAELKKDKK